MPEIEKDLFEGLSLLLLLIAVIALLALLASMSRVTKLLREQLDRLKELSPGGIAPPTSTGDELESSLLAPAALDDSDSPLETASVDGFQEETPLEEPAATSEPGVYAAPDDLGATPQEATVGDESGADAFAGLSDGPGVEAASTEAPAETADPFAGVSGGTEEPASTEPAAGTAEPFVSDRPIDPFTGETEPSAGETGEDPFTAQPVGVGATQDDDPFGASSATTAAAQDDEQPFEQGGRWYFRRDNELLVYDETTGEWVDAEEDAAAPAASDEDAPAPAPVAEESASSWGGSGLVGDDEAGSFTRPEPSSALNESDTETFDAIGDSESDSSADERASGAGGFWKCPSCGAVNGSTASTCRMCFAARP